MEENYVGYVLGLLDEQTQRQVEAFVAAHPEANVQLDRLRRVLEPLASDKDVDEPPAELAMRTVALVAAHVVTTEERVVEDRPSPVAEFLRSLGKPQPAIEAPVYPWHASDAAPQLARRRDLIASLGLSAAVLLIGVTSILTLRQAWEVEACKNNMRVVQQGLSAYCNTNDNHYPQVASDEDVRRTLTKLEQTGTMPAKAVYTCPGADHPANGLNVIDYAYSLGYRDDHGVLQGLARHTENDSRYPIFADAPKRENGQSMPINHRKGQNVLFADGHVSFCTHPNVGPDVGGKGDDIYFNIDREARAGKHSLDCVLGRADDQP